VTQTNLLIIVLLGIMAILYYVAKQRAITSVGGVSNIRQLHSLPGHYGIYAALWAAVPAVFALFVWTSAEDWLVTKLVISDLPEQTQQLPAAELSLIINDIKNMAAGDVTSADAIPEIESAANHYSNLRSIAGAAKFVIILVLAIIGGLVA
jgi:phosphate transport system permease protein